jgi:RND family efflux transporter MFP subunit
MSRPPQVEVINPRTAPVVQTITVSGQVAGLQESSLGPEAPGVLTEILVDEGQQISPGQIVARVSSEVLSAEARRAQAAVDTARAQLQQTIADAGLLPTQIDRAQAEVSGQVDEARERLERARLMLDELQKGGTSEQRRQAQADVAQAEARVSQAKKDVQRADRLAEASATARAALERAKTGRSEAQAAVAQARAELANAERDFQRTKTLYQQGAVAEAKFDAALTRRDSAGEALNAARSRREQADVEVERQRELLATTRRAEADRAQTEYDVAQRQLESARARLEEVSGPAREEAVRRQEAEIRAAEAALKAAREAGRARIANLRQTPNTERIRVARQRVDEAVQARDAALARLNQADVYAPYPAVVTDIISRPGTLVGTTTPIMIIVEMVVPEVRVDVDERDLKQISTGQKAVLVTDVYPDRSVDAEVSEIAPRADTQRGVVEVTVVPTETARWLKSGMTVDATIITAPKAPQLLVPARAVMTQREDSSVMTVEDGLVRDRRVQTGSTCKKGTVITSGLTEENLVVLDPLSVTADEEVEAIKSEYPGGSE